MSTTFNHIRNKYLIDTSDYLTAREAAFLKFKEGNLLEAFDILEQLVSAYPDVSIELLAQLYDFYQLLPLKDRYHLYQARLFDFPIKPSDRVLDIGSGNVPFPLATHLADITLTDDYHGRAGCPFKYLDGKPVYEVNIEDMPFKDKEFDFIYCSHVLEHVGHPEKACQELMRVAKMGYIETPTKLKDTIFNTAGISNHKWDIYLLDSVLVFREYTLDEIKGLDCDIFLRMNTAPETIREKAVFAIAHLKANALNTMFIWDESFYYRVERLKPTCTNQPPEGDTKHPEAFYNSEYFSWQKNIGAFGGIANLFKFIDYIKPSDTVIDFGCGGGYLLSNLTCFERIGIEINEDARQQATTNGVTVFKSIEEIANETADVIISNHALEHAVNPFEALRSLYAKLKLGGKIVFVVPHQDVREEYTPDDINKHLYTWNQLTLGNLFTMAGFKVLVVEAIQHQWPPDYQEIYTKNGEEEFHKICKEYAIFNNNHQIRIIATKQ